MAERPAHRDQCRPRERIGDLAGMEKRVVFRSAWLPWALLAPQVAVIVVFFFWPAAQALLQSFQLQDAFGTSTEWVGLENFADLFHDRRYLESFKTTAFFSRAGRGLGIALSLLLAVFADRVHPRRARLQDAADLAVRGGARGGRRAVAVHVRADASASSRTRCGSVGIDWNRLLNGDQAMALIVMAAVWKQISLQLPVLPRRAAVDPEVADRGGGDRRRAARGGASGPSCSRCCRRRPSSCWSINIVYAFFDTFGIIDAATAGRPGQATRDPGLQGLLRRLQGARPRRLGGAVGGADGDRRSR